MLITLVGSPRRGASAAPMRMAPRQLRGEPTPGLWVLGSSWETVLLGVGCVRVRCCGLLLFCEPCMRWCVRHSWARKRGHLEIARLLHNKRMEKYKALIRSMEAEKRRKAAHERKILQEAQAFSLRVCVAVLLRRMLLGHLTELLSCLYR